MHYCIIVLYYNNISIFKAILVGLGLFRISFFPVVCKRRKIRGTLLADPIKLFFFVFTVKFECFVTYRKKSPIVKRPSLATKNGEILR